VAKAGHFPAKLIDPEKGPGYNHIESARRIGFPARIVLDPALNDLHIAERQVEDEVLQECRFLAGWLKEVHLQGRSDDLDRHSGEAGAASDIQEQLRIRRQELHIEKGIDEVLDHDVLVPGERRQAVRAGPAFQDEQVFRECVNMMLSARDPYLP